MLLPVDLDRLDELVVADEGGDLLVGRGRGFRGFRGFRGRHALTGAQADGGACGERNEHDYKDEEHGVSIVGGPPRIK